MTDPVLGLETAQLTVEPGGQVRAEFTVLNPGTIVESYTLDVVGEQPIPWAEVLPPVLSVYPQQQETATVVFNPPAGPTGPGGTVPFGIRAKSQVDPSSSAVVEGQLEIGQVFGLQAKLTPVTSSGRWRGLHTIQFSNWGNAPARLRIVASDPDQALGFLIRPEVVDVPLGATVTARIKARTRKPVLRGSNSRLPFKVVGEPDPPRPVGTPEVPGADPGRPAVDGAFTQKPILSRGVVMAATVAGAALIGVLVFALTRGGPAVTPTGDGVTVPAKPVLTATTAGPAAITLEWELLRNVDSYTLQYIDPLSGRTNKTEPGLDVQQNAKNVDKLASATKYCFKLRAINGKLAGPESEPACATTAKAAPTPSGSPTPGASTSGGPTSGGPTQGGPTSGGATSGGPTGAPTSGPPSSAGPTTGPDSPAFAAGQWIALVDSYPAGSGVAEQTARDLAAQLKAGGVAAQVLNAAGQYPGLTNAARQPLRDAWVVYVGPVGAADQAATLCRSEAVRKVRSGAACIAFQPAEAPN
ncbi:hypothetical protein [Kribbella sp. VKM Ac-2568]|uniref:fibronectin type III domain-containing protein n=1 Tax=Kribbella sp. VKM Ac-2568 TaxID=2512219 RepID=UPI001043115A|nr:hypothetical protein [Kribbella sp. VKM Ac-2568]TCM43716.1 hypothetical protein EV648_109338 [Kribbella sp. VKM Ac-2568]